jgi:TP901 family phage tail tape measure protein
LADVNAEIGVSIDTSGALAQLKALQREITRFHSSVAKSSDAAALAQRDLQKNFVNGVNAIQGFSAELRTVKTTAENFTDSLERNKFSMREYFRYSMASTKTFGRMFSSELDTVNKVALENVKRLQTQYIKMGRDASGAMRAIAVMPTKLDLTNVATQTQLAAQKQALFNQLVKQGSTNLLNFGKNTQWAGRQLMVGFTIPLMGLGAVATRTFMDMETAAIKFKKVYGDLFTAPEETQFALESIQMLGQEFTKYGIAVADTVSLAAEAAAAGFSGSDLQAQVTQATRLQVLGQVDQQKALETTISLQNAFKISSTELADAINFLNAVENQTVVSLDDITTAIPKAAPIVKELGGDIKDLAFFMAAMKEGGINASEGANALKSGLASLINPTDKAKGMLSDMGIDIDRIVESNVGNLKATVVEFAKALDGLSNLQRQRAIEQLFGKFQQARLSALFDNVIRDGNQASRVLDLASASMEDLASLAEKELGLTADSAMNKFRASIEKLKLSLAPVGEVFLQIVTPLLDKLNSLLTWFNSLPDSTKKAIAKVVLYLGGLAPVILMTIGLMANFVANGIKGLMLLRNGFLRLTGQSKILGEQTNYLSVEQQNAVAAAASLEQSHIRLQQAFTGEAGSIRQLIAEYQRMIAAQNAAAARFPGMMQPGFRAKGYANGIVSVPGPKGAGDVVPAMVSPGEAIIPTAMNKKYAPLVQGIISDSIPGYKRGLSPTGGKFKSVDVPGGYDASHFGGSQYRTGQELLAMVEGIDTTVANNIRKMIQSFDDGLTKVFTVFDNRVVAQFTDLNRMMEQKGSAPMAFAMENLAGEGFAQVRDLELQDELLKAGMSMDEYKQVNKKITQEIINGFDKLGDKTEITSDELDNLLRNAYEEVAKTDRRVEQANNRLKQITTVTDPRTSSRVPVTEASYTRKRKSGVYAAGMRAVSPGQEVYSPYSRFGIKKGAADLIGLSLADTKRVYDQFSKETKVRLSLLKDDIKKFHVEFVAEAEKAGLKVGNAYKVGVDKSNLKDIYVESRQRTSPHPLASKDGKDDGRAYQKARAGAVAAAGGASTTTMLINPNTNRPFTEQELADIKRVPASQISVLTAGMGGDEPDAPGGNVGKSRRLGRVRGAISERMKKAGSMGGGFGLSGLFFALSMLPGKFGQLAQSIMPAVFALQAVGMLRNLIGPIPTLLIALSAGIFMLEKSSKKAAEEIANAAKMEAEARYGSVKSIEEFSEFTGRALPSAREFSRNNKQLISASGEAVKRFAEFYNKTGNRATQVINAAAMRSPEAGMQAAAVDVAQRAAIFGLSPADIAANIKAAADLIGADQVKLKMAVQEILSPDGKDITKEPLTIKARMEFLRVESDRQISSIKTAVKEIGKISIPQFGPLGLGTDFAGLKRTAGYQAARNKASEEGGVLGSAKAYAIDIGTGTFGKRYQDQLDTFNSIQSKIQSASTQITIAFTQEKESLALLNAQYSDGLITREEYDAQFAISMDNLTKLEEVTRDLVVELDKIDESGELSAAAVKDLGNEALAALKKTNPALFKKISAALAELDANAQIDIYMGYAAGSLTILDLAKLPQVLKDIDGKSASVALNIIGNAGLSTGAAGLASIPVLEADLKRVNKLLEAGYNTDLIRERDSLIKQIAAAKKAQTDAAKVNQTGSLDTDNANKGGATGGAGKFLNPYEKELDLLKKKRDALKEVNDELDRQNQYQMKQLDLINQAAKAKMTGDYLQAASLQQQSLLEGAKFARESRIVQMDRIIGQVEERSSIVADTKKLTSVDQTLLKKLRAGSYGSIAALPTTPNVGFGAKPGATGVTGTNIGGSVYNVTMNVTGSNAEEISNKVIAKLKLAESKMNKTNRIPL